MSPTPSTYSLRSSGTPSTNMARPTRIRKVSAKVAENDEIGTIQVQAITRAVTDAVQPVMLAQLSAALEEQRSGFERQLSTALEEQRIAFTAQIENLKAEITTLITTQVAGMSIPERANGGSYAAIARTPLLSQPTNLASTTTTQKSVTSETLYCTIDTSRVEESRHGEVKPGAIREAIEKEIRGKEGNNWRCAAVMRDPRNGGRIRVACRDEKEHKEVKEVAEKVKVVGARVLRDQLFPVKVDGVNRFEILDERNQIRPEITDNLGKENEVEIAKLAWLSKKDNPKAYGSMVIYVTKGSYAKRLLQDQFFHVAGESGWTSAFERRLIPTQCYNCQQIGHKAFNCKNTQVCGKCAQEGHHHRDCINESVPKCVPCGGPHESFSKNCQVLYPRSHE